MINFTEAHGKKLQNIVLYHNYRNFRVNFKRQFSPCSTVTMNDIIYNINKYSEDRNSLIRKATQILDLNREIYQNLIKWRFIYFVQSSCYEITTIYFQVNLNCALLTAYRIVLSSSRQKSSVRMTFQVIH